MDFPGEADRVPGMRVGLLAVLLFAGVVYLWGLGSVGFQDPDEGMYAEIAREMLLSGDWIVPTFNGVPYVEKPPLMYWLTAGTFAILGPSEFSARIWKVLPVLGAVALTGALGQCLFSAQEGILAATILATTMGTYLFSRITVMDPLLLLGIMLAACGIACAGERPAGYSRGALLCFWGGITIGVMSKGLPGLAFSLILLVLWTVTSRNGRSARALLTWHGALGAALLILPWHVFAALRVPGFFQFYVVDNQILRFLGMRAYAEDGQGLGAMAFLVVTSCALFPWVPQIAAAITAAVKSQTSDGRQWFLLGWMGAAVGICLASSFRLEYYALPAFPAAALLVAALVCRAEEASNAGAPAAEETGKAARDALRLWTLIALGGGILYCLGLIWIWQEGLLTPVNILRGLSGWSTNYRVILQYGLSSPSLSPGNYAALLLGGGILWMIGFGGAAWQLKAGRVVVATVAVAFVGLGLCVVAGEVLREVAPHHSLKPLAERLNATLRPGDIVVHERGLEKGGGLLFYIRRPVLILDGIRGDLEFGSTLPGSADRFIDTRRFQEIWGGQQRAFLVTDLPIERSAIAPVPAHTRVSLASTGTRWLYSNRVTN
jgi:4-amino-4-deoxy-L-arabinose transferase-like glycosyltransferase